VPILKQLWQSAFGDTEEFLQDFFSTAYSPLRCRVAQVNDQTVGMLYWFDVTCRDQKLAYLYAVATHPDHRNRGLCRKLLADTHALLSKSGYAASVLVPGEKRLFEMYEKMGYQRFSGMDSFTVKASNPIALSPLNAGEYATLRRQYLPEKGIRQEGENLAFFSTFAKFYGGDGFVFACSENGEELTVFELLSDRNAAPGIVAALGKKQGYFRIPGSDPFAMFCLLTDAPKPGYLGLAFD
jgi:predicted N-acetyltransferase YhbS